jgi:hypothetical protein
MKCAYCGTEFPDSNKGRLYCSEKCSLKRYKADKPPREPIERPCGCCGKVYTVSLEYRKYCSEDCRRSVKHNQDREHKARRKAGTTKPRGRPVNPSKQIGVCDVCGKEFEKAQPHQISCSQTCKTSRKNARQQMKRKLDELNKPTEERKNTSRPGTGVVIKQAKPLPDSLFANCELCGKEYVKSTQANGRCPVCRGIYHVQRVTWNHNRMEI